MIIQNRNPASLIKRRRATRAEVAALKAALFDMISVQRPMTVRQVFYQATVHGLVEKTEQAYGRIQWTLAQMRKDGDLPYSWLTDSSRSVYRVDSFETPKDAIRATARFYRKSLWAEAEVRVEIWCEKDALSGVILPITDEYDVGLYVARGFASLSYLHAAAQEIAGAGKPTIIYHLGDHDPSGVMAAAKIEETLRDLAPEADIYFERLAVTEYQKQQWNLPSRPTKKSSHDRGWRGESVELDAIQPDLLRELVRAAIEEHLPPDHFRVLKVAEESERAFLEQWATDRGGDDRPS
ncbi:hypothetical protein [Sinorhizobium meliloti]|uniref:hypothetical protein n=1 Tax=Rhizobium meliloti TaxID=382 RepID=UPI0002D5996F|nr:hypothetical protein [Sinorhizobium meliloti]MDE4601394.1 hypothetical protein [Sinorhizobium meliloti]UDU17776.1 hypothetical protein LJD24_08550 [Sinorhizobium meliloti]